MNFEELRMTYLIEITKLRTVLQLYAPAILWSDSSSVVAEV